MVVNSIQLKCPYEALKGDLEIGKLSTYESLTEIIGILCMMCICLQVSFYIAVEVFTLQYWVILVQWSQLPKEDVRNVLIGLEGKIPAHIVLIPLASYQHVKKDIKLLVTFLVSFLMFLNNLTNSKVKKNTFDYSLTLPHFHCLILGKQEIQGTDCI